MFAGEHRDVWPPLSPVPDNWIPDARALFPEYLSDLNTLVCPGSPFAGPDVFASRFGANDIPSADCVSSLFYTYVGYMIWCDEQAEALFDAARDWGTFVGATSLTLTAPVWTQSDRVTIVGQGTTPVLWDRVPLFDDEFSHAAGINVLHMDGHVEFVRYSVSNNSNYFPATRCAAETFGSVLPRMSPRCRTR